MLMDEDLTVNHNKTLESLDTFTNFGTNLESSVRGICRPLDRWTSQTTNLFDRHTYIEKENRYIHYKTKLTYLVQKLELKIYNGRRDTISSSEYSRIDRNIVKLRSQIEVMTAICGEKVVDFCGDKVEESLGFGSSALDIVRFYIFKRFYLLT